MAMNKSKGIKTRRQVDSLRFAYATEERINERKEKTE